MIDIAATVEYNRFQASLQGFVSDESADFCSHLFVVAVLFQLQRGSGYQGVSSIIVDDLRMNMLLAAEDTQSGALSGAMDFIADPSVLFHTDRFSINAFNQNPLLLSLLFGASLTDFALDLLISILDAFAFVGLRRAHLADVCGKSPYHLLVDAADRDFGGLGNIHSEPCGNFHLYWMRVS